MRTSWIGFRGRTCNPALSWPVWLLAAVAVFLGGLRIGLNVETPRGVIDVGYAGVIGADRILDGQAPYGNMPVADTGRACGKADAEGAIRDWIQSNGRCESANPRGDTYGPTAYLVYVPATLTLPWSGKWDSLPAAHATAIAFDLLVVLGLLLIGRRFGGLPLAVALAFGWLAFPFTAYAMNSNSNDAILPAFLVWGFWLSTSAVARGAAVALSSWTKFASLLLAPLWLTYPNGLSLRTAVRFTAAFVAASLAVFSILLLEPSLTEAVRVFVDRTLGYQLDRHSPFSPWDWGQYHARGIPDLHAVQLILQVAVLALAGVVAVIPRRKGPLELAALSAAVLLGFELALTHWSYLYIPWFLPFVLLALLLPRREPPLRAARRRRRASRDGDGRRTSWCSPRPRRRWRASFDRRPRGRARDLGHARLPDLRRADGERRSALPRLRGRVPARGARSVRAGGARLLDAGWITTPSFQALMVFSLALASRADRALARGIARIHRSRRALRRRLPRGDGAARAVRADALRPLRRSGHPRRGLRDPARPQDPRAGAARGGDRDEDLPARSCCRSSSPGPGNGTAQPRRCAGSR